MFSQESSVKRVIDSTTFPTPSIISSKSYREFKCNFHVIGWLTLEQNLGSDEIAMTRGPMKGGIVKDGVLSSEIRAQSDHESEGITVEHL